MLKSYLDYLQNILGNQYIVVDEEKIDANYDKNKNLTIVNQFSGINYKTCVLYSLQATVYTNDIPKTMQELREFSWKYNDERLQTNVFPYIRQLITQPINNSNFAQLKEEYIGTITLSITLICAIRLTDVKGIYFDNELIDPNQVTITYQATPDTQRNNYEELNSTNINETSLNIQITYPVDNTELYKKTRDIMFGILPKNTDFNFKIEFTDNQVYETTLKLMTKAINLERSSLTTNSVTFIH